MVWRLHVCWVINVCGVIEFSQICGSMNFYKLFSPLAWAAAVTVCLCICRPLTGSGTSWSKVRQQLLEAEVCCLFGNRTKPELLSQ